MDTSVLFAGIPVADFSSALAWYERFFARPADVVAHDTEVMWKVSDGGWLYIVREPDHAGHGTAGVLVADLEKATSELAARGVWVGPIASEGDAGRKALAHDPDGNSISIIEVPGAH